MIVKIISYLDLMGKVAMKYSLLTFIFIGALGLAGVAIKAGARSALASLWFVSDQASAVMVDDFYKNLSKGGISKARALQQAQQQLRSDPRFRHPRYWAPYILIGNWL